LFSLENAGELEKAAAVVSGKGIAIVPTETFYGLAANPFHEESVSRIFRIKRRSPIKPIPLIAASRGVVEKSVSGIHPAALALMDRFWPGSLTIILKPAISFPGLLVGTDNKIGVRVPPNCPARSVAEMAGGWITATSANLSGEPEPRRIADISPELLDAVDFILDMGTTPGGKPSTVVEADETGIRIFRKGAVLEKDIRRALLEKGILKKN
jgi:L-threonylcarbamoyladenylate synthase